MGDALTMLALTIAAVVYAVSSQGPEIGSTLPEEERIPALVRGVYLLEQGTVQLAPGSRASLGSGQGPQIEIESGRLRLVAETDIEAAVAGVAIIGVHETEALVEVDASSALVCAVEADNGWVHVLPSQAAEPTTVEPGTCQRLMPQGSLGPSHPFDPQQMTQLQEQAAGQGPMSGPEPDMIGDPEEHLVEVETEWAEALEQGARQEAAACGCSEDGGGGGSLDTTGPATPSPDPEQLDHGRIRVRVRISR